MYEDMNFNNTEYTQPDQNQNRGNANKTVRSIAKLAAAAVAFGLIAGVYYLYQSFCAFKSGVPFGEIGELSKAVGFIVFPFIAYLVSYVSRKIYTYFEENAY